MSDQTAITKDDERRAEYIPYGLKEKISLTVSMVKKLLCNPTKSGKLCSDDQAVKFIMLCKTQALNPFAGDAFLVGFDSQKGPEFSLITAAQVFYKRAEANENFDGIQSGVIVRTKDGEIVDREGDFYDYEVMSDDGQGHVVIDGEQLLGGWATVYFKNRTHPIKERIRLQSRRKNTKFWDDDPAGQISKCAEAGALRRAFPTLLGGMYTEQELANVPATNGEVAPAKQSVQERLKAKRLENKPMQKANFDNQSQKVAEPVPVQTSQEPVQQHSELPTQEDIEHEVEVAVAYFKKRMAECTTVADLTDVAQEAQVAEDEIGMANVNELMALADKRQLEIEGTAK